MNFRPAISSALTGVAVLNPRAERRLMARISADPRHLIRDEAGRRHGDLRRDAAEYVQKRAP
jgi:hypothetical protein